MAAGCAGHWGTDPSYALLCGGVAGSVLGCGPGGVTVESLDGGLDADLGSDVVELVVVVEVGVLEQTPAAVRVSGVVLPGACCDE